VGIYRPGVKSKAGTSKPRTFKRGYKDGGTWLQVGEIQTERGGGKARLK